MSEEDEKEIMAILKAQRKHLRNIDYGLHIGLAIVIGLTIKYLFS